MIYKINFEHLLMTTAEFIQQYRTEDIRQLAFLAAKYPNVDAAFALDQIRGWQIARKKLTEWAKIEGLQFPPHLSMEQCSSEQTALYKAAIANRLFTSLSATATDAGSGANNAVGDYLFVDITGGFGVDFSFIASQLNIPSVYVEQNENLCQLARHNFPLLNLQKAKVVCGDGTEYAKTLTHATIVYMDPARRNLHGARTYGIEDCTPNVLELLPMLMQKTHYAVLKLSPMLDWHNTVDKINGCLTDSAVAEIHIVSVANECKELLVVVAHGKQQLKVECVNDNQSFTYLPTIPHVASSTHATATVGAYLFEPNASCMKAGCFAAIEAEYGVRSVGANSHLFVADNDIPCFPGRRFEIHNITTLNKKELKQVLVGITKANISTRNFPLSVAELRKKLKLADGGNIYIFATTIGQKQHVMLICNKLA